MKRRCSRPEVDDDDDDDEANDREADSAEKEVVAAAADEAPSRRDGRRAMTCRMRNDEIKTKINAKIAERNVSEWKTLRSRRTAKRDKLWPA